MSDSKIRTPIQQGFPRLSQEVRSSRREARHNLVWNFRGITREEAHSLFDKVLYSLGAAFDREAEANRCTEFHYRLQKIENFHVIVESLHKHDKIVFRPHIDLNMGKHSRFIFSRETYTFLCRVQTQISQYSQKGSLYIIQSLSSNKTKEVEPELSELSEKPNSMTASEIIRLALGAENFRIKKGC